MQCTLACIECDGHCRKNNQFTAASFAQYNGREPATTGPKQHLGAQVRHRKGYRCHADERSSMHRSRRYCCGDTCGAGHAEHPSPSKYDVSTPHQACWGCMLGLLGCTELHWAVSCTLACGVPSIQLHLMHACSTAPSSLPRHCSATAPEPYDAT